MVERMRNGRMEKSEADQFNESPFRMIGKEWMLVTAEKDGKVNAMTASWGGMGVMWGQKCCVCRSTSDKIYKRVYRRLRNFFTCFT